MQEDVGETRLRLFFPCDPLSHPFLYVNFTFKFPNQIHPNSTTYHQEWTIPSIQPRHFSASLSDPLTLKHSEIIDGTGLDEPHHQHWAVHGQSLAK